MDYAYASISVSIFFSFTTLFFYVYRALHDGYIDKKALWFMTGYAVLFFLKAVIYSVKIIETEENLDFFNFVLVFGLSCTSDLITFMIYTFILSFISLPLKLLSSRIPMY